MPPLEDLTGSDKFIDALNRDNPAGPDPKSQGDDHIRGVKNVLLNTFPNMDAACSATPAQLSDVAVKALFVGMMGWFHGAPAGWLQCNGQTVSKTTFSRLWAYGQNFLTGDQTIAPGLFMDMGGDQFKVPNLSGMFLRSVGVVDANHGADGMGVKQADTLAAHTHSYHEYTLQNAGTSSGSSAQTQVTSQTFSQTPTGGTETRPINVGMVPCIFTGT
ncbi:MAG: hypothetical protein RI936_1583 [Pseudomonadota bacterium]|jgi:microcystin-dependent protein